MLKFTTTKKDSLSCLAALSKTGFVQAAHSLIAEEKWTGLFLHNLLRYSARTSQSSTGFSNYKLQCAHGKTSARQSSLWAARLRRVRIRSQTKFIPIQPKRTRPSLHIFPYAGLLQRKWPRNCFMRHKQVKSTERERAQSKIKIKVDSFFRPDIYSYLSRNTGQKSYVILFYTWVFMNWKSIHTHLIPSLH